MTSLCSGRNYPSSCPKQNICSSLGAQVEYLGQIESLRRRYKPSKVRVLFIVESPPRQEGKHTKFFYSDKGSKLSKKLKELLVTAGFNDFDVPNHKEFLKRFQEAGFYLIDVIRCPMSSKSGRKRLMRNCIPFLQEEIRKLDPEIIIILGRTACEVLRNIHLHNEECKITNMHGRVIKAIYDAKTLTIIFSLFPSVRNKGISDLVKPFRILRILIDENK